MSNSASAGRDVVADSERMIAELVATVLGERLQLLEMDSGGSIAVGVRHRRRNSLRDALVDLEQVDDRGRSHRLS